MARKKHSPGCSCCTAGCEVKQWTGQMSEIREDFTFIGDEGEASFQTSNLLVPGAAIISNEPWLSPAAWLFQFLTTIPQPSTTNLPNIRVRWIAHATPLAPEDTDYYTKGPLGDHIFGEMTGAERLEDFPHQTAGVQLQISIGMVVDGVETIFDTTTQSGGFVSGFFGQPGRLCYVEAPTEGRFERLVDPNEAVFLQGDPAEHVVNTFDLGYGPVGTEIDFPGPGSLYTFTKPCRVYEQTTDSDIDTGTAPFVDVEAGQGLRRWGTTREQNYLLSNCQVVDLENVATTRFISFGGTLAATEDAPTDNGLTVSGPELPETLPSGGHVGIQVIPGHASNTAAVALETSPPPRVTRTRSRFNPTCEYCSTQRNGPCIGDTEMTKYADLTTNLDFEALATEFSAESGGPDQSVLIFDPGSASQQFGNSFSRTITWLYQWGFWPDDYLVQVSAFANVTMRRMPYRRDKFRVSLNADVTVITDVNGDDEESFTVGVTNDPDYLILDTAEFDCSSLAIQLDFGAGDVFSSSAEGKFWTLSSL